MEGSIPGSMHGNWNYICIVSWLLHNIILLCNLTKHVLFEIAVILAYNYGVACFQKPPGIYKHSY